MVHLIHKIIWSIVILRYNYRFRRMRYPENATECWEEMTLISSVFWPRNAWMSGISHIMAPQYLDKSFKLFLYFI